jgi:diguanylate cyclase
MALLTIAFLSFGAAPLHPSAEHLLVPVGRGYRGLNRGHLVFLGVVLLFSPVSSIAQTIFDRSADPLVLAVGSVLAVPLVLIRIGQLSAQRDRVERILAHHARHDELTSLLNRRAMLEEIDDAMALTRDGSLDGVALLFCDLDGFKAVNDRLGHQAGDELLQAVAGRLVTCTREVDIVGRFGGDEFLILCRGGDDEAIDRLAERVDGVVRTPMTISGETVAVGVSIGVAIARPGDGSTRDTLISAADKRMYHRKRERGPRHASPNPAPRSGERAVIAHPR